MANVLTSYFQRQKQELEKQKALETFRSMVGGSSDFGPEELVGLFRATGDDPIKATQFIHSLRSNKLLEEQRQEALNKPFTPSDNDREVLSFLQTKGRAPDVSGMRDADARRAIYSAMNQDDYAELQKALEAKRLEFAKAGAINFGESKEALQIREEQRKAQAELEGIVVEMNDAQDEAELLEKQIAELDKWVKDQKQVYGKSALLPTSELAQGEKKIAEMKKRLVVAKDRYTQAKAKSRILTKRAGNK